MRKLKLSLFVGVNETWSTKYLYTNPLHIINFTTRNLKIISIEVAYPVTSNNPKYMFFPCTLLPNTIVLNQIFQFHCNLLSLVFKRKRSIWAEAKFSEPSIDCVNTLLTYQKKEKQIIEKLMHRKSNHDAHGIKNSIKFR